MRNWDRGGVEVDEFDKMVQTKLTHGQKRGFEPGRHSKWELHNDRRTLAPPVQRTPEELYRAQVNLASIALGHEDLQTEHERRQWLAEVLSALGLGEEITWKRR